MARFRRWLTARQQPPVQLTVGQRRRFRVGLRLLIESGYILALLFLVTPIILRDGILVRLSLVLLAVAFVILARGYRLQLLAMTELFERWPVDRATVALDDYRLESRTAMASVSVHAIAFFLTSGIVFAFIGVELLVDGYGTDAWVALLVAPGSAFALAFLLWRRMARRDRQEQ